MKQLLSMAKEKKMDQNKDQKSIKKFGKVNLQPQ